jgi:hypothetical protein
LEVKTELVGGVQGFGFFSTEIKGDLLILFHKNPGLIDTLDAVARRIGRSARAIEEDVRDLVSVGILKVRKIGIHDVISFDRSRDDEAQEAIVSHLNGLKTGDAVVVTVPNSTRKGPK